MQHHHVKSFISRLASSSLIFILFVGVLVYELVQTRALTKRVDVLSQELASTTQALSLNTNQLSQNFTDLRNQTLGLSTTLNTTQQSIDAVKNQVGGVEQYVGSMSGTVNDLQKLSQADPQLLKKYSKVYFTNENYTPPHLTVIPTQYLYSQNRQEQFLTESWPYLENLLEGAKANGITIYVKSGYRSFAEQKSLKSAYSVTYGAGTANAFSAEQGYSEHQLGTTIDFITTGTNGQLTAAFDKTLSYLWLVDHAHQYGFILSYPKGNTFYMYEPWHWRFVGIKLATYLHDNKLNFYDVDQRIIDKYLVNIFD